MEEANTRRREKGKRKNRASPFCLLAMPAVAGRYVGKRPGGLAVAMVSRRPVVGGWCR